MKTLLTLTVTLIGLGSQSVAAASDLETTGTAPALSDKPMPLGASDPAAVRRVFNRQLKIFGIRVLATRRTPDAKLRHAAAILAGYLDNDRDGRVDNPQVVAAMVRQKATLVMFATEREAERLERTLPDRWQDSHQAVALFAEETHPGGAARRRFDASYEEIFHLITHAGYAAAYPAVFGMRPGSQLANAMDRARGGRFLRVPRRYPAKAWYTYDDRSCDYGCQTQEYIYWGMTSLLGAQSAEWRFRDIRQEWRLNTPKKFRAGDPMLYRLLTDSRYRFPKKLPDGKYRVSSKSARQPYPP